MQRSIVIHGHFYQPPRENPWLEDIEREASASPYHDWNTRIERECYRAVTAARVLAPSGRISRIINTLEYISFNFGPTLLEWMERAAPDTYARILDADRKSLARLGHGNAIAQPYHHAILPLSSRRDKVTEVRWGIADFRRRFGRDPEGMWLPETALDDETLDVLAQEGMRFTIVAPGQVRSVPNDGHPGRYTTSNGRTIALCIYDGDISHGIAFGGLLGDARVWAGRMLMRAERRRTPRDSATVGVGAAQWQPDPASDGGTRPLATGEVLAVADPADTTGRGGRYRLVAAATDGETYGHHHRFAEMALARVILDLGASPTVTVENFASFLARRPASEDVEIVAPSAWSCAHGVERWRSNCGCRMHEGTNQEWRTPLRDAISALADGLHEVYEREGGRYFDDPWAVRDAYGEVVAEPEKIEAWVAAHLSGTGNRESERESPSRVPRPESLLEMARGALRIFTSCAWFFDDIAGLEPVEVLRYAARAIELAGADGPRLEDAFVARLADAKSNDPNMGTGRDVYLRVAKPGVPPLARLAASAAAARVFAAGEEWRVTSPALALSAEGAAVVDAVQRVRVHQRRTAEHDAMEVSVSVPDAGDGAVPGAVVVTPATVSATAHDGRATAVTFSEMTERQRAVIEDGVRRRLTQRVFGNGAPPASAADLQQVLAAELIAAIDALASEPSVDRAQRVAAVLDLLALDGGHIPFDAQTRFHDAFGIGGAGAASIDVSAIAFRLGFATTDAV